MNINRLNAASNALTQNAKQKDMTAGKTFQEKRMDGCLTLLDVKTTSRGGEKSIKENKKAENYDRVELSSAAACSGNPETCHCDISEEEKIANRRKVDFAAGTIIFMKQGEDGYFLLPDGTEIPGSHVSNEIDPSEIMPLEVKDNNLILKKNQY